MLSKCEVHTITFPYDCVDSLAFLQYPSFARTGERFRLSSTLYLIADTKYKGFNFVLYLLSQHVFKWELICGKLWPPNASCVELISNSSTITYIFQSPSKYSGVGLNDYHLQEYYGHLVADSRYHLLSHILITRREHRNWPHHIYKSLYFQDSLLPPHLAPPSLHNRTAIDITLINNSVSKWITNKASAKISLPSFSVSWLLTR